MNRLKGLIQKEFLEQRWILTCIYITFILAPLVALYTVVGVTTNPFLSKYMVVANSGLEKFNRLIGFLFINICFYNQVIYFLGSCFIERLNRSIIFWRSMPVSDSMFILAKILTGFVFIPLCWALATVSSIILSSTIYSYWHMDSIYYITLAWNEFLTFLLKSLHYNFFLSPLFLSLMLSSSLSRQSPAISTAVVSMIALLIDDQISKLLGMPSSISQLINQFYNSIFTANPAYGFADYLIPVAIILLFNVLACRSLVAIRKRYA